MKQMLLPGDRVRLSSGDEAMVNSAHYYDYATGESRQQFSVMGKPVPDDGGPLYYADESELLHRCAFKADPITKIRRCACGGMPAMAYLFGPYPNA